MAEDTDAPSTGGLSRRSIVKGLGAGAALAWSAPAVLSVGSAAHAASPLGPCVSPNGCETQAGGNCSGAFFCGPGCQSGTANGGVGCYGVTDTEGHCFCAQGVHGCQFLPDTCTRSSDCGPGRHCVVQGCCGTVGHCYDCCGQNCH